MEYSGPILDIFNIICDPLSKCCKYHCNLSQYMENLREKLGERNCRKEDVESRLRAELLLGKETKKEVELWLQKVVKINGVAQALEQEVLKGKYLSRVCLGRRVWKMIQEVDQHYQKGSFNDSLVVDKPLQNRDEIPPTPLAGGATTETLLEEISECLLNDDVRKIGVYGMGGIGKTTIMKHIHNKLLNTFEAVIWITVSKSPNLSGLQNDIARKLNEDFSKYEDETEKATKLFSLLKQKKRWFLILDDIWEPFSLEEIGIPEPTSANGCKLALTTRSLDVCRRMGCKEVKMKLLTKMEAWNLFLDKVGREILLYPDLKAIATQVADECACLPLAIVTIAVSMRGVVDINEWSCALEELRESIKGLNEMDKVLERLKFSFTRLKDEKLQCCLQYCALYPEDFAIERTELIRHLIAEGIIEEKKSRQAEFNKGHAMLNKLENACLLERVIRWDTIYVKMHDLIRDMAINITSEKHLVESGRQLKELPDTKKWMKDLERISLMRNHIVEIPCDTSPKCQRLSTLFLSENRDLARIADSFFLYMHSLKVLDLSHTKITNLPNSISDLENLTALYLQYCPELRYLPSLAKIGALRELDLSYSGLKDAPQGIEMLTSLRYLNLFYSDLEVLPVGILPKLSSLQCLIVCGRSKPFKVVKPAELASLRKLESFGGQMFDLLDYHLYVKSLDGMPSKYHLQVGTHKRLKLLEMPENYYNRIVKIEGISGEGEEDLVLPNDVEFFTLKRCNSLGSLIDVLSSNKEIVHRTGNTKPDGDECVLLASSSRSCSRLQPDKIEDSQFVVSSSSIPSPGTFSFLILIKIQSCSNLRNLFKPGLQPRFPNVKEIAIYDCCQMEEIVAATTEEYGEGISEEGSSNRKGMTYLFYLPKLKALTLSKLPELKSICRGLMTCDSLVYITVSCCPKLKRLPLALPLLHGKPSPPPNLKVINVQDKRWWRSLEWNHQEEEKALQPFCQYLEL
ncbi:LRR and NB-ARC domains-containing disease resistance protein, putative [Theobroma cacao]|uniref:LRR and NB-ARC domains-containing disease resistance protein, putative n=1 Tax=Theobroma cacao TaxID=3641 RepID=A0A061F9E8_THECC|nr:LRR and NB-ARC domains-containing disease resistance protein, putative [Theobroma cacao]